MTHKFDPTSLREYDIRGIVGKALGTADAYAIGRGFATHVRRAGGTRVAVGYDGRVSSPELEVALIEGLTKGGVDVVRIGLGPTPMLYYAEATLEVDGGIQITGSQMAFELLLLLFRSSAKKVAIPSQTSNEATTGGVTDLQLL